MRHRGEYVKFELVAFDVEDFPGWDLIVLARTLQISCL